MREENNPEENIVRAVPLSQFSKTFERSKLIVNVIVSINSITSSGQASINFRETMGWFVDARKQVSKQYLALYGKCGCTVVL